MPLDVPNLDDRRWAALVEEAQALIPRAAPAWTDHNVHDPGITFIELFAWLTEMQLYQVNRVGERHREAFARLAGVRRRHHAPARVMIRVEGKPVVGMPLAAGAQFLPAGQDDLIVETDADVFLTASQLQRVVVDDGSTIVDQTDANQRSGIAFLAFGEAAAANASLRLGFDAFYRSEPELRLTFDVFTDDLRTPCDATDTLGATEIDSEAIAPVELVWESLGARGWSPLAVISDSTRGFMTSGAVTLPVPQGTVREHDLMWLRVRIVRGAYDIEPRLRNVALNILPCVQMETIRDEVVKPAGEGQGGPDQTYALKRRPLLLPPDAAAGRVTSSDVADWARLLGEARLTDAELAARLTRARAAADDPNDADRRGVAELNRDVAVALRALGPLLGREPVVVSVNGETWRRVESFDESHPDSQHFVLQVDRARLVFGNGLNGRIPAKNEEIRAVWYRATAGAQGNVAANQQWRFRGGGVPGIALRNVAAASGGTDPETLADLELRGQANLRRPNRGVTARDLERLALATPHVHVARAKAVANCPQSESITVVVLPKVRPGRRRVSTHVSETFLTQVRRHLERHRLLCDDIRVIGPVFVAVSVSARLRLAKGAAASSVVGRAGEALDRFLRGELDLTRDRRSLTELTAASPCPTRWPFGRAVRVSEIYAVLETVTGVDTVWGLALEGRRGTELVPRDPGGAIPVPVVGLATAAAHHLVVEDPVRSRR